MARSFSIGELVQLPTLDAASAVTLVKRLLTLAGQHKKLPAAVDKARKRLETGHAELAAALSDRLTVTSGDPRRSQAADQAEDLALSALYDFLTAYSKLPESAPESARAARLLATLYPDGLRFTQLTYAKQWAETSARLQRMAADALDRDLKQLGGEVFLQNLQRAHKEYGEALGVTQPKAGNEPAAVPLREPLQRLLEALRKYVLQLSAQADPEQPATEELAAELLAPLRDWQSRPGRAAAAAPEAADPPAAPAP